VGAPLAVVRRLRLGFVVSSAGLAGLAVSRPDGDRRGAVLRSTALVFLLLTIGYLEDLLENLGGRRISLGVDFGEYPFRAEQ